MNKLDERITTGRPAGRRVSLALTGVLMAALLVGAGGYLWFARRPPPGLSIGGPFTLQAADGRVVTDRDFRGKYMLVYFGYTHCPDECPATLTQVAVAMDRLGASAKQVRPLFITVDPRRDTPAIITSYATNFSPSLLGLSGSQAQIDQVSREYGVIAETQAVGAGSDDYAMSHTSVLYLMGPDGRFVAPIPAGASGAEIAADVAKDMAG